MADRFPEQSESDLISLVGQKNGDRMIKQLLNSVIAKYRDLSVSCRSIIYKVYFRLRQIIDLLATDKSQYFAQPRPIIVNRLPVVHHCSRYTCNNSINAILPTQDLLLLLWFLHKIRVTWPE